MPRAAPWTDLEPEAARDAIARDPELKPLDVRTEHESRMHRLPGAVLVPIQQLARRLHELDPDAHWLVHCEHGHRSVFACELLAQAGFTNLANLSGGLARWIGRGLPVER